MYPYKMIKEQAEGNERVRKENELKDLKTFALKYCCDIFDDFEEDEVRLHPGSIQCAWEHGRKIKEFDA